MDNEIQIKKEVPFKNYLLLILMIVAVVLITLYIFKFYKVKNEERLSESYLVKENLVSNKINNIQELKEVLNESPSKLVLYITYHNSSKIYKIEKELKDIFNQYNLTDIFYIFDITSIKDKVNDYADIIDETLDINVVDFPAIVYYEDGQIVSYKKINNVKDVKTFFEKNNIEKNSR